MANRIDWIDYEKGFILLFVCLSHCGIYSPINGYHMAAFFFISGLLFNNRYKTIKSYITRKFDTLLKPYFLLSFCFLFFYDKLYDNFFHNLLKYGNDIIQGYSSPNVNPLWFVYILFFVCCIFYFFYILFNKIFTTHYWILIFSCLCFCGGWLLNGIILPFKFSTLITSLSFFSLGVLFKDFYCNNIRFISNKILISILTLLFIIWFVGQKMVHGVIGYNNNSLGNTFTGYFIVSFFGIHLCTLFFYLCNKTKQNAITRLLKYIANNGIIILALHMFVINICSHYLSNYNTTLWYPYVICCIMVFALSIFIPLFNRYLPWMIGK